VLEGKENASSQNSAWEGKPNRRIQVSPSHRHSNATWTDADPISEGMNGREIDKVQRANIVE